MPSSARQRHDLALGVDARALRAEAEHARLRVAPHVGVEHADLLALGDERRGEVRGHARLADAALAGADADHVLDLGERALGERAAAELAPERLLLVVGEDVEGDVDAGDALELAHGLGDAGLEVRPDRAARRGQRDHHIDDAVLVDSTERTISSSTMSRRSSGSITERRASITWSRVGMELIVGGRERPAGRRRARRRSLRPSPDMQTASLGRRSPGLDA